MSCNNNNHTMARREYCMAFRRDATRVCLSRRLSRRLRGRESHVDAIDVC